MTRPWHSQARPDQLPPADGDWSVYLVEVGRGWGATRTGAEWIAEQAATHPKTEWLVVAPTWRDVRAVCFEGNSGVLKALLPGEFESYSSRNLRIRLTNGSLIRGAAPGDFRRGLRVADLAGAWLDQASSYLTCDGWNRIRWSVPGRIVVTTSPANEKQEAARLALETLADLDDTIHVTGQTWANEANLPPACVAELRRHYGASA